MSLAEHQEVIQTFMLDGPDPGFRKGVQIRRAGRVGRNSMPEDFAIARELRRKFSVAVAHDVRGSAFLLVKEFAQLVKPEDDELGAVSIVISAAASKKLQPTTTGVWDLQLRDGSGIVRTLVHGTLKIAADITQRIE